MSDYSRREDVIKRFDELTNLRQPIIEAIVKSIPACDVEEVVRCQDCFFWEHPEDVKQSFHVCSYFEMPMHYLGFCSNGEKRRSK